MSDAPEMIGPLLSPAQLNKMLARKVEIAGGFILTDEEPA